MEKKRKRKFHRYWVLFWDTSKSEMVGFDLGARNSKRAERTGKYLLNENFPDSKMVFDSCHRITADGKQAIWESGTGTNSYRGGDLMSLLYRQCTTWIVDDRMQNRIVSSLDEPVAGQTVIPFKWDDVGKELEKKDKSKDTKPKATKPVPKDLEMPFTPDVLKALTYSVHEYDYHNQRESKELKT